MNAFDVLEDLIDDDPFIRSYPSFDAYMRTWVEFGGEEVYGIPMAIAYEFYAEKIPPEEALHIWFTYDPLEQLIRCKEVLSNGAVVAHS